MKMKMRVLNRDRLVIGEVDVPHSTRVLVDGDRVFVYQDNRTFVEETGIAKVAVTHDNVLVVYA